MPDDDTKQESSETPQGEPAAETPPAPDEATETVDEATSPPAGGSVPEPSGPPPEPRVGIVFPAAAVALQLLLSLAIAKTSTTPMRTYMGIGAVPLVGALLLLAWWLLSRRVPLRDRLLGAILAVAALAVPLLASQPVEVFLLVYVLPTLTTGLVVVLLATQGMKWAVRRNALLVAMALCTAFYCLVKVSGVDGNMAPLLSWRWSAASVADTAAESTTVENQVAAIPKALVPEDWSGFRGAKRDGRNVVSTFGIDWDAHPPKELWRHPAGVGWSSFTVIGDYCFTQEQRGPRELVVCYENETGNEVWVNAVETRFDDVMGDGPRATPEYHLGKLYTQGATGILQCIDAATGATIWQRDLKEDAGMKKPPQWGFSSSPLATGDLVAVYTGAGHGKSVIAYKQDGGDIAWTAGQGGNGYSSPQMAEVAATPQILISSNFGTEAFDPATGALLWDQEWDIEGNPRVSQPYVLDLYNIFAGTGQGKGVRLIKVTKEGDALTPKTIYTSDKFRPYFNDFAFHDGYLYGFDGNRFTCMETTNGAVRFAGERWGGQVLVFNEMDMVLVLTEAGEVILVAAFPGEIVIEARMQALHGKTWNHPVVAHGKLFVRNDHEAACYELPPVAPKEEPAAAEGGGH